MKNQLPETGIRIKQLRTERAWSQEQLAQICGVNVRTIQRLENGGKGSPETLKAIAAGFELDVRDLTSGQVSSPKGKNHEVIFMARVVLGKDLCGFVRGTHGYRFQNDDLESDEEVESVGNFLQDIRDTGDLWSDMEPLHQVQAEYRFTKMIRELEGYGFWVFAAKAKEHLQMGDGSALPLTVALILILRNSNPKIVKVSPSITFVPAVIKSELPDNTHGTDEPVDDDDVPF
jgi:transcriptional regulator with XRE-family HTH domain